MITNTANTSVVIQNNCLAFVMDIYNSFRRNCVIVLHFLKSVNLSQNLKIHEVIVIFLNSIKIQILKVPYLHPYQKKYINFKEFQ